MVSNRHHLFMIHDRPIAALVDSSVQWQPNCVSESKYSFDVKMHRAILSLIFPSISADFAHTLKGETMYSVQRCVNLAKTLFPLESTFDPLFFWAHSVALCLPILCFLVFWEANRGNQEIVITRTFHRNCYETTGKSPDDFTNILRSRKTSVHWHTSKYRIAEHDVLTCERIALHGLAMV